MNFSIFFFAENMKPQTIETKTENAIDARCYYCCNILHKYNSLTLWMTWKVFCLAYIYIEIEFCICSLSSFLREIAKVHTAAYDIERKMERN